MNYIVDNQNKEHFIVLLKAQRVAYSQAKRFYILDTISVVIALVLPIVGIFKKDLVPPIGAFGVIWTILFLICEVFRRKKTIQGAKIQEQFDTELFGVDWNQVLCKRKIDPEIILDLSAKITDSATLINWYSSKIVSGLPQSIASVICQRINLAWDRRLRSTYANFLLTLLIVYYGVFISLAIVKDIGIYHFLILLAPTIPFLTFSVKNILAMNHLIKSKESNTQLIDGILDKYAETKIEPENKLLRQLQDVIYNERTTPEKVPDWFYYCFRRQDEGRTDSLIESLTKNL